MIYSFIRPDPGMPGIGPVKPVIPKKIGFTHFQEITGSLHILDHFLIHNNDKKPKVYHNVGWYQTHIDLKLNFKKYLNFEIKILIEDFRDIHNQYMNDTHILSIIWLIIFYFFLS